MIPALVLASALLLPAAAGAALQKKVLILGVDGTMPSALAVARTPNLNFLRSNGCYSDRAVTDPVTHSAACWSSMFTGVWGDKHKVQDPGNSFAGNRFDLFPSFMRRAETARPELNTLVYARWAPLTNVTQGADVNLAFSSDEAITVAACQQLTNANPDLFYSILLDVDSAGHSYGWGAGVTNYVKAIETADARIGRILGALTNRASFSNEDWLVVTLSDHGQHDSTTERSRVTFHILYGPAAARGPLLPAPSIVDVCATVLTHLGLPIDPAWNLDARVEGLAAPVPGFYTNLIRNGDGESNSGGVDWRPDRGVAWWWDTSGATLGRYDASNRFTAILTPGAPGRGSNFFLGGSNAATVLSQVVPLEVSTGDPGVDYTLSAWLGGISNRADSATLTARFLAADGALLGQRLVGPVTVADRGGGQHAPAARSGGDAARRGRYGGVRPGLCGRLDHQFRSG